MRLQIVKFRDHVQSPVRGGGNHVTYYVPDEDEKGPGHMTRREQTMASIEVRSKSGLGMVILTDKDGSKRCSTWENVLEFVELEEADERKGKT